MLNNLRKKLANKIHPGPSGNYPFVKLNWKSDEDMIREGTVEARALYKEETGNEAVTDQQARDFSNNYYESIKVKIKKAQTSLQ